MLAFPVMNVAEPLNPSDHSDYGSAGQLTNEINLRGKAARLWHKSFNKTAPNFNGFDLLAPLLQASAVFSCFIYIAWWCDNCPLDVSHRSKLNFAEIQNTAAGASTFIYAMTLSFRLLKKYLELKPATKALESLHAPQQALDNADRASYDDGAYDPIDYLNSLAKSRSYQLFSFINIWQFRLFSAALRFAGTLCIYAVKTIQENNSPDWRGCVEYNPGKITACSIAIISGLWQSDPLEKECERIKTEIKRLSPDPNF